MEYQIIDPDSRLSKTQKSKIRTMLRDGLSKQDILDKIHYTEGEGPIYKDFQMQEVNEKQTKIIFSTKDPKDVLKERLRQKIHGKEIVRQNQCKDEAWKAYYQLLQHPSIRALPDQTIQNAIPTPDAVQQQRDVYRMVNKMNPNPIIKNYIDLCLGGENQS